MNDEDVHGRVAKAVLYFWAARLSQQRRQGEKTGVKDAGTRGAVTGGKQLDGFVELFAEVAREAGIAEASIYYRNKNTRYLPGFFRPTKEWDLLVVGEHKILACIELKSQVGSFGNNANNRTEEAIGNAQDFWTAYREGAFEGSPRPWLGYFMLLEEAPGSVKPVGVKEPHFPVFAEFKDSSYAERYELLCLRLVRERLYDAACLILSPAEHGSLNGTFTTPNPEVGPFHFLRSLSAHVRTYAACL